MDEEESGALAMRDAMRRSPSIERIFIIAGAQRAGAAREGRAGEPQEFQEALRSPRAEVREADGAALRSGSSSPVLVESTESRWGSGKLVRKRD